MRKMSKNLYFLLVLGVSLCVYETGIAQENSIQVDSATPTAFDLVPFEYTINFSGNAGGESFDKEKVVRVENPVIGNRVINDWIALPSLYFVSIDVEDGSYRGEAGNCLTQTVVAKLYLRQDLLAETSLRVFDACEE